MCKDSPASISIVGDMERFEFKGTQVSGGEISGQRRAGSKERLRLLLAREGIVAVEIWPWSKSNSLGSIASFRDKRALVSFTRQLAVMLRNGMRLDAILRVLQAQQNSKAWQQHLKAISSSLNDGNSLSNSLASQPTIFDQFYISLVRAGESSGDLAEVFARLAKALESSDRLKRKIKAALAYPAVITAVAAIVLFVLLFYIVPVFKEMFLNFQTELPPLTRVVVKLSDILTAHPLLVIIGLLASGGIVIGLSKTDYLAKVVSQVPLHTPGLRNLVIKSETANFARTMATLLWGGVALNEAISLAASVVRNVELRGQFESASGAIAGGSTLNAVWSSKPLIPPMVSEMVAVGEETGQLARMFDSIADFYSEEIEALLPAVTAVLEPLLIVIVGVFVAAILISMYLPLLELIGQLG